MLASLIKKFKTHLMILDTLKRNVKRNFYIIFTDFTKGLGDFRGDRGNLELGN